MAPKKQRNRTVSLKRVKVTVEMKRKIVELKEQGMCVKDIARTFARPSSTICTILKNREKFMEVDASSGLTRISTKRLRILDDVEWLLLEWIRERHRQGEAIDEQAICERARAIAADLVKALPGCAPPFEEEEFKASRGWFERFKQRTGMQDAATGGGGGTGGGAGGLLVATRHGAVVNLNQGPPLLPVAAAVAEAAAATVNSSSCCGGGGSGIKENPDRTKTEPEPTTPGPPLPAVGNDDSADDSSSASSSSGPEEGQQRANTVEGEQQMSSSVSDMLRAWQSVAACIERYHPNRAVAAYVTAMFNEYGVAPVRLMWERMQEQRH